MADVALPQEPVVYLRLLYDAFAPETVETHELKWRPGARLSDYLKGLPEECEWMVFVDGDEVDPVEDGETVLEVGSVIGLVLVPQGGNGGLKSVMRIVLQAAAIAALFIPGINVVAAAAISVGVGLINAFLLTPKPPKTDSESSKSYGIDGAKNSATEGIPYPIVYGEFRTAGNFSDCFTENVGDDQFLYVRSILNDGEIHSVRDVEINEQRAASFQDVDMRIGMGTLEQGVNDWFANSIVQINKNQKIDIEWIEHITTTEVDKVRFDVTFTNGLVEITDEGKKKHRLVDFMIEVQKVDPITKQPIGQWQPAPIGSRSTHPDDLNGDGIISSSEAKKAYVKATGIFAKASGTSIKSGVEYREVGASSWTKLGEFTDTLSSGIVYDPSGDGSIAGNTDITPGASGIFEFDLETGKSYEVRAFGGATIDLIETLPSATSSYVRVTDKRSRQIRKSFETERLERGYYNARIRRLRTTSTDDKKLEEVYLADVAEIEMDRVALKGTANLALRIRLSEQLSNIPTVTSIVKGSILQEYDIEGNPTIRRWSANPAWIGLDILCGLERGAGIARNRIDWPRWIEFAEYCDQNNITFNGVFDIGTNVGDALQQVLRIGHAAPIPFGTKISVAVDRPRAPVAVFTSANILKDTFEVGYMPIADRSNEFEVTYYDKMDRNKAKTLRYVDPKAVKFDEVPRTAQVQLVGVDNHDQAKAELWRMIYANRLLIRTVNFESFLDSINLTLGDVALIQHSQMEWADDGRLLSGNTASVLRLDRPVTFEAGETYSALVHFDHHVAGVRTISSIAGRKVLVSGGSIVGLRAKRLVIGDKDFEILKLQDGATYHTITLAETPTGVSVGSQASLVDTDVLFERPVSSVQFDAEGRAIVTLATPLPAVPKQYANFVFGRVEKVRKPFALTGISGTGIEKRKLTFVEYHEGVYGVPEVEIPIPTSEISTREVAHVSTLLFDYEPFTDPAKKAVNCRVHWNAGSIRNYAGADVYMSLNGAAYNAIGSAQGANEHHLQLSAQDEVSFRVVAYNDKGDRAPVATAPVVKGTIKAAPLPVAPPPEGEWVAQAIDIAHADGSVPAISIAGASSNAQATAIAFFYREPTDQSWMSAGTMEPNGKSMLITAVKPSTEYETGVAYVVNEVTGQIRQLENVTVGRMIGVPDSVLSDIEQIIQNGGVPPSVLAPSLQQKIDLIAVRSIEGMAATDRNVLRVETETTEQFLVEKQEREELAVQLGEEIEAAVATERAARVSETTALSTRADTMTARIGSAEAAITQEQQTRANETSALSTRADTMTSRIGAAETAITQESQTRASQTEALSNQLTLMNTRVGTAESAITQEQQTRASQTGALTTQYNGLNARMGTAEGNIITNKQIAADATSAVAEDLDALEVRVGTAEGQIITDRQARVNGDSANATLINQVKARLDNISGSGVTMEARVASLNQAIVDEQGARAQAINQVTSNFNGQISGIQTTISSHTSRLGTVENKWVVTLDANGKMAGIGLINGTDMKSEFGVRADRFIVFNASGQGTAPFFISGGQTYIHNAVIQNAAIDTLKVAGNAITVPVSAFSAPVIGLPDGVWTTVQSASITSSGAQIFVSCAHCMETEPYADRDVDIRILRDGIQIYIVEDLSFASGGGFNGGGGDWLLQTLNLSDTPGAGAHTYEFQAKTNDGASSKNRSIFLLETKR